MVIVVMQPGRVGVGAGFVASVELGVCPLGGESAIEPLDLPVGLRSIWSGPLMRRSAEGGVEGLRAVAGSVVGEHPADDDAVLGEEQLRAPPERGRSLLPFVGEDF